MKNKLLYSIVLGAALIGFNACSLDEKPIDQLPEDEAYKSKQLIYLNAVAGLYTEIGADGGGSGLAGTDRGLNDLNLFTVDEAILPTRGADWYDGGLWVDLYQHKWTSANDLIKSSWDYLYRVIGKCNQSIDKMQFYLDSDPDNTYLVEYIAEVRALRAMYYYYLLDNFARVPIVTSSSAQISDVNQSDRSEVFNFVKTELQESVPLLKSAKSAAPGEFYGRMTKSVAYFLLAKLALNARVYTDNTWDLASAPAGSTSFVVDGTDIGAWKAVIKYCDLITGEGYALNPSYSANFSVQNEGSVENIFVIPMDPTLYKARNMYSVRTRHYAHGKAWADQDGWNGASATTDLLRVFREGSEDPRLEQCFFMGKVEGPNGNYVMDGDVILEYKPDAIKINTSNEATEKTAGARWKKYEFDLNAQAAGQLVNNDYVLYRYADVLLMKAEAMVRDGQNADAILKDVRDRVSASKRSATLDNILKERMLELSWEGFRRQDLIRFGQFNKPVMDRNASDPYRKVFPIPLAVLENNKNLSQNAGY